MLQWRIRVQRDALAIAEEEDADNAAKTLALRMQGGFQEKNSFFIILLSFKHCCQDEVRGHAAVCQGVSLSALTLYLPSNSRTCAEPQSTSGGGGEQWKKGLMHLTQCLL